jgi:hypothetical protein
MTRDFGARRSGRTLRRDRRAQPLPPIRQGQARRASACRVAVAEGTEQRGAKRPGPRSQRATRPCALNKDRVACRRAPADCRVSVAAWRLPVVRRFDAPSFLFAVGEPPALLHAAALRQHRLRRRAQDGALWWSSKRAIGAGHGSVHRVSPAERREIRCTT